VRTFHFDRCYWSVSPRDPNFASQDTVFREVSGAAAVEGRPRRRTGLCLHRRWRRRDGCHANIAAVASARARVTRAAAATHHFAISCLLVFLLLRLRSWLRLPRVLLL
jgi:hypothetical protein